MNENELKPCPFCGRDATTEITTEEFEFHGGTVEHINFSVCCPACRIEKHSIIEAHGSFKEAEKAMQEAINYWNNRTDSVKHGNWITGKTDILPTRLFTCSECRGLVEIAHYAYKCYYNYCPNCGAKMNGSDKSERNGLQE